MKLPQLKKIQWNYTVLAFVLPFAGLLLLRLVETLAYNGVYSMLYSDQYHQYYPFFVAFRKALLSGDSLLFSWNVGMGMDYLGLISYYLASPLNLLSVLVPESMTLAYFSLLMPLKLGFAGMFFALFLKKVFGKDDFSITAFGCFYALCAWALGYQWNIMWLDTFALLPLVALGTVSLLKDKKFVLYTVSLFFSVCANYYIGFFTCIFVLLSFICYQICRCKSLLRLLEDLGRIALFSVLALGMTLFLTLPGLLGLQSTQSSVNSALELPAVSGQDSAEDSKSGLESVLETFGMNIVELEKSSPAKQAWTEFRTAKENGEATFSLWWKAFCASWPPYLDGLKQVAGNMNGGLEPSFKEGLPNLYCGISAIILAFLFLTCRRVKLRDKICSVVLLVFLMSSCILRQLDYIWHGFHFTNMIPYRFSFLFSFVLLYMAYRAWLLRRSFRVWQIAIAGVLSFGIFLCSEELTGFVQLITGKIALEPWSGKEAITSNMEIISSNCAYVLYNLLFLALYLGILLYGHSNRKPTRTLPRKSRLTLLKKWKGKRQLAGNLLLCVMVVELTVNVINFGVWFPTTNVKNYPKGTTDTARAIRYMYEREEDTLFFRAETTHSQTLNDGALNGYNGVSTFTSSANVKVTEFMKALGYGAKNTYNRYCFEESSPVANLFLNLKYMIERDGKVEKNPYFDDLHYFGNVHLLENNAYLPLGFLASSQLINVDFAKSGNRFTFQNELLSAATGLDRDVWIPMSGSSLIISSSTVELTSQNQTGYCSYTSTGSGTVVYSYTADREGLLCVHLDLSKKNSTSYYLNGEPLFTETYSLPQMLSITNVVPGDVVEIRLTCKANERGTINISAATLDETAFRVQHDILNTSTLELTEFKNTYVEGKITCDRDGVLYTSIPQDGNWSVTVDGKPANAVEIGGAMVGVLLTQGEHTVAFRYHNKYFSLGWKLSLVCLVIFLVLYLAVYQPKLKGLPKGKYEK